MRSRKVIGQTKTILTEMTAEGIKKFSTVNTTEFRIPSEPPFVKFYLENITFLLDLPKPYGSVIYALLPYAPYADKDEGWFGVTKRVKEVVARNTGHTVNYVEHVLGDLVRCRIMYRDPSSPRSSTYRFNPYLIARGEWKDIHAIRMTTNFFPDGSISFKSELVKNRDGAAGETTIEMMLRRASEGGVA